MTAAVGARRLVAVIPLCVAALALGGCPSDDAVTFSPLVQPSQDARAVLKPGIWSYEVPCPPGEKPHLSTCGIPMTDLAVTPGEVRMIPSANMPANFTFPEVSFRYVVATGEPYLVQQEFRGVLPFSEETRAEYSFAALEPRERDQAGNIVAAVAWPILCGPPPAPGDPNYGMNGSQGVSTNHPFKGMKELSPHCIPRDLNTIRAAAMPSRTWFGGAIIFRYVRDDKAA